jgi:parallel beta-helix repeat protein
MGIKKYIILFLILLCPVLALAATWQVGSDGDYATVDALLDAESPLTTGDDILFKAGESHTFNSTRKYLLVNWDGTSGDRVIIGKYGVGADPIIEGNWIYPNDVNGECTGTTCYTGLIQVTGDYVTLQTLDIRNAGGAGIRFSHATEGIVDDCLITKTFRHGFVAEYSSNMLVQDSSFYNISRRTLEVSGGAPVQAGVTYTITTGSSFLRNYIQQGWGEGFGSYNGSSNITIDGNLAINVKRAIYVSRSSNTTVSYNLAYRTPTGPSGAIGISMGEEGAAVGSSNNTHDNLIYGNAFIGPMDYSAYFFIGIDKDLSNDPVTYLDNIIANNTFVGATIATYLIGNKYGASWAGSRLVNNISYPNSSKHVSWINQGPYTGMSWGPNLWSVNALYSSYASIAGNANDIRYNPIFAISGLFTNLSVDGFTLPEILLQDGTYGVGTGIDMSSTFTQLFSPTDTLPGSASLSTVSVWDMGCTDVLGTSTPSTELNCNDLLDNDADGFYDCADSDCSAEDYCEEAETLCSDGFDNDGDGLIDCIIGIQDPDCGCSTPTGLPGQPIFRGGSY